MKAIGYYSCLNLSKLSTLFYLSAHYVYLSSLTHTEKFKTGMTKEYAEKCRSITPAELLELLKSHDHDAVVSVDNKRQVISKKELNALLDRSHLVQQWQGMYLHVCALHYEADVKLYACIPFATSFLSSTDKKLLRAEFTAYDRLQCKYRSSLMNNVAVSYFTVTQH